MRRVRSEKQAEKWKRKLDRYREIQRQIREAAPDITFRKFLQYKEAYSAWQYDGE